MNNGVRRSVKRITAKRSVPTELIFRFICWHKRLFHKKLVGPKAGNKTKWRLEESAMAGKERTRTKLSADTMGGMSGIESRQLKLWEIVPYSKSKASLRREP